MIERSQILSRGMPSLEPIDPNLLAELIREPERIFERSLDFQLSLAQDPHTPPEILTILVQKGDRTVAEAAGMHVNLAGELTSDWQIEIDKYLEKAELGQNDRLAVELLKIGSFPPELMSRWIPSDKLIETLKNPDVTKRDRIKFLERLALEPTLQPRFIAAISLETPLPLLEKLAGDIELAVRLGAKNNPNCPPELRELLDTQEIIASNWNTRAEKLAKLGKSYWGGIRLEVAQNPSTPAVTLRELAEDKLFEVKLAVAKNPTVSKDLRSQLLQDPDRNLVIEIQAYERRYEYLSLTQNDKQNPLSIYESLLKPENNLKKRVEKWLVPTGPEAALTEWKHIEETQVASPTIDIDEDEREEAGITLDEDTKSARFQAYRDLFSYLTANLDSLQAYTLSYNSDYSLSAIAAKLPDNRWICLSPTVPQETGKYPVEEMRCIPLESEEAIAPVSDAETQIHEILAKLNPIKIFGWYGGGYEHLHDYRIIYATGDTLESALQKCLMKAGLIEVYKFDRFFARVHSCGYDAENNKGMGDRFERLNHFMKATFADLRMYLICFWDWEHLYLFDFTYNP